MTTLLKLIRERRAELERRALEHLGPITDEMRAKVLCEVIAAAQRNPGGPEAEKLRRFCEDPECRAWFEKMWRDVSQETGPDALTRSILWMQSEETFGDASRGTERPESPPEDVAPAVGPAGAEEPAETLFDLEAARRVTTNSPVPYLPPVRSGKNQSWHDDGPDPANPGTGWMSRR
jgi:hypothetical protein